MEPRLYKQNPDCWTLLTTLQYRSASAPSLTRTIVADEHKCSAVRRLNQRSLE